VPEKARPGRLIPRPRLRTARPLKTAEVNALIAGYQAGTTMKELAAEFGIDRRTVPAYLYRAGVATRRGGLDRQQTMEAALLYDAGWSSGRLAERFGVSADTILKALRVEGVQIRRRRGGAATSEHVRWPTSTSRHATSRPK
jgi:uncharacterized protein (DUF433 family)